MCPDISIEPASASHADAAAEITPDAFDGVSIDQDIERTLGSGARPWRDIKANAVRDEFNERPHDCFVALAGGQLVGYVTTRVQDDIGRGTIANLAVRADFRGHGIGRKLLARALDYFRQRGLVEAKIETLATNPIGQRLYPSVGFVEVARQIHYAMRL